MAERRVYLDYAASTPVMPEVVDAILPYFTEDFGNASSLHGFGIKARGAIEDARGSVAAFLNTSPENIVFTGSGTESDNLAIQGYALKHWAEKPSLITSVIEHPAVYNTFKHLEGAGFEVFYVSVDREGIVNMDELESAITPSTGLISIHYANNEIGTVEPIVEIGKLAAEHGIEFHTDAVQALGKRPIDVANDGVTMLSASGHKVYAPKGAGILYLRDRSSIEPLMFGGDHEFHVRPSTENVPAIVGLGAAVEIVSKNLEAEIQREKELREYLITHVISEIEGTTFNGSMQAALPTIASLTFEDFTGYDLVLGFDTEGTAVSAGSACHSSSTEPSRVLTAIGLGAKEALSTIRVSIGRPTTQEDVDYFLERLPVVLATIKSRTGVRDD